MTDTPRLRRQGRPPNPGILHLGPGAFFRAFLAPWTDEAMRMAGGDWGIIAVSLQSPTARDQLIPQDCVYTALERGPDGDIARQVDAITNVMVAPEDPAAVIILGQERCHFHTTPNTTRVEHYLIALREYSRHHE